MSIFYEPIYCAEQQYSYTAYGLREILITIGKCEYERKRQRAIDRHCNTFTFPSDVRLENRVICDVNGSAPIMPKYYLTEGIAKINKATKRGCHNKTAIKRLINAQLCYRDGYPRNVFRIHKYSSVAIFEAILRYLKYELYHTHDKNDIKIQLGILFRVIKKNHAEFFGPAPVENTTIVAKPYWEILSDNEILFRQQEAIVKKILEFNKLT